ncbi:bis(5'-nucleosyl)-tetraphosphatase (symmetrical) YqeK [Olsenella sp. DNF00959]|uniref:bis(5'-nucleosyl)-tetraphosphatase (symmetrical) YqeK n=1 Tax=Olsenella sp. DNF00959 TaxID=1476999 RepID=UPI0007850E2A|nr:bis(5'-nucleosyl)-tetraphosphatase (symmetrical) YqeK [Olsenella sp. DNF00959]KXB62639.1 hydrolase, HD family [Olsenella sp. DNF00959]
MGTEPLGTCADYDEGQASCLERLEGDLRARMAVARPRRLEHSLSVARCAESLALSYGVDPFLARAAGTLHDWDKVLTDEELLSAARDLGIDLGVDLHLVLPLLHGLTAARELPGLYPELPPEVFRAIGLHTLGSAEMSPLDMVVFVADGIEPLRPASPGIQATRDLVSSRAPLGEVYWSAFAGGVEYVIKTRRYLYPGTIEVYNALALAHERRGR